MTKDEIRRIVTEEDVAFIRLQFADMFGTMKNVAITPSQLERALEGRIMLDGSSIEGFVGIEKSDMYLVPDLSTFTIFPWRPQQGKVARLICDVYNTDRTPFSGDPRGTLKRVIAEAEKEGYILRVGPELEFFLFETDGEGRPTTNTTDEGGYFDLGPVDFGENARRDMVLTMEEMDIEVEASHHEGAPAQHEIDFHYSQALKAADQIETARLAIRTIAQRHGLHASFMPKPKAGVDGSGMHINLSLWKDGRNVFAGESGKLSDEAMNFIGGIFEHIKGMSAILNPLVNSYKRLVPGFEAPAYICWGEGNRTPLIRIPFADDPAFVRMELRNPDSAANPYLALALILAAGLKGIREKIDPPSPISGNINALSEDERNKMGIEPLPTTLGQAVKALEKDLFLQKVLGYHLASKYIEAKKKEWFAYNQEVSDWEIKRYLNRI